MDSSILDNTDLSRTPLFVEHKCGLLTDVVSYNKSVFYPMWTVVDRSLAPKILQPVRSFLPSFLLWHRIVSGDVCRSSVRWAFSLSLSSTTLVVSLAVFQWDKTRTKFLASPLKDGDLWDYDQERPIMQRKVHVWWIVTLFAGTFSLMNWLQMQYQRFIIPGKFRFRLRLSSNEEISTNYTQVG